MQNLAKKISDFFCIFACFYAEGQPNSLILISRCETISTEYVSKILQVERLRA